MATADSQYIFHRGDKVPVFGGGNNPLFSGMCWSALLSVCSTVLNQDGVGDPQFHEASGKQL
jgi:hypothetical protein